MANVDFTLEGTMKFSRVKKISQNGETHQFIFYTDADTYLNASIELENETYTINTNVPNSSITLDFITYNNEKTINVFLKVFNLPFPISLSVQDYDVTALESITAKDIVSILTFKVTSGQTEETSATKDTTYTIDISSS